MIQSRTRKRRRPQPTRRLRTEQLEPRQLMSADFDLHNEARPTDVNEDGKVTTIDALTVINHLSLSSPEGEGPAEMFPGPYSGHRVDVDNSGVVTALDALIVVNDLRLEGEISPTHEPRPAPLDFSRFPRQANVDDDGFVNGQDLNDPNFDFDVTKNFKTLDPDNPEFEYASRFNQAYRINKEEALLTTEEVNTLLDRASAATSSEDAIIVVVDRNGTILGVRVEEEVSTNLKSDPSKLAFAIDGAAAKARTAAFFANNAAPLTSRTIRSLSQTTMAQRVVESSPANADARYAGPGFVAPIGVGGKFPPEVNYTPQVDLFAIEHQSRDSQRHPGPNQIKGDADDFYLRTRFNGNPENITFNSETFSQTWPEPYGIQTDTFFNAVSRGVATLPGGVPLYKVLPKPSAPTLSGSFNLVGGIGVFFPGEDGFATHEQDFQHGINQSEKARTNASKVLEAEFAAVVAAAGSGELINPSSAFRRNLQSFNQHLPPLRNFILPTGRIDLVGITLEIFGPNPDRSFRFPGIDRLISVGNQVGPGEVSGALYPVRNVTNASSDSVIADAWSTACVDSIDACLLPGQPVPEGWLIAPRDSSVSALNAEAVDRIISDGVLEAQRTRAAIRLDIDNGFRPGVATGMVLAVADTNGELLGVFRMPDATIFSVDVAVAKARNTSYYADKDDLQDEDRVDFNGDGNFDTITTSLRDRHGDTVPRGTALTNRTFRFLSEPRYPGGIEIPASAGNGLENDKDLNVCDQQRSLCLQLGPQSILRMPGIHPGTSENLVDKDPLPAAVYQFSPDVDPSGRNSFSVLAFDAFNQSRNFRDPGDPEVILHGATDETGEPLVISQPLANQNGVIFFPGSSALFSDDSNRVLIGGFGVSGDGVDQDDVVTAAAHVGFEPEAADRVDQFIVAGVRLPYQKFNRSPRL